MAALTPDHVKDLIQSSFTAMEYPGDRCLTNSREGEEPERVAREFKGKTDWLRLAPEFIDQAPDGLASALSFFSDEAFRFYLPAYLIADLDGKLERCEPIFALTRGFDDASRKEVVNRRRYGERTWFDCSRYRFSMFTRGEVGAIVAYMSLVRDRDVFVRESIDQALANYWWERARSVPG